MKVACIQMDMLFSELERNYQHGKELIAQAMAENPDVIVLPETWTTGFFPKRNLEAMCDDDGARVKAEIGALAAQYGVNIVAGSVANMRGGKVYNTAYIFDRTGACGARIITSPPATICAASLWMVFPAVSSSAMTSVSQN